MFMDIRGAIYMKKSFNAFTNMVYPMLISLFLFCFVDAFITGESHEALQLITAILTIIFGLLFVIGFIYDMVCLLKKRKDE